MPVVVDAAGEALDVGRSRRLATKAQRDALRAMYRTCGHPDCDVGFDACRIHHVRYWWEHHGPTDLDNLLPLCERHHHLVHEGGWSLELRRGRCIVLRRPDGTVSFDGVTTDRRPAAAVSLGGGSPGSRIRRPARRAGACGGSTGATSAAIIAGSSPASWRGCSPRLPDHPGRQNEKTPDLLDGGLYESRLVFL